MDGRLFLRAINEGERKRGTDFKRYRIAKEGGEIKRFSNRIPGIVSPCLFRTMNEHL